MQAFAIVGPETSPGPHSTHIHLLLEDYYQPADTGLPRLYQGPVLVELSKYRMQRNTFAVNTAFLPLQGECTLPEGFTQALCPSKCRRACTYRSRIQVMMERYTSEPIFGVMENKLLMKLVLRALRIPHTAWLYAALVPPTGSTTMPPLHPDVPWYRREDLIDALRATAPAHRFVLKPLTEGGNTGVIVMDRTGWSNTIRNLKKGKKKMNGKLGPNATVEESLVARLERKSLLRQASTWNQRYEHRGVVLEERYGSDGGVATYELKAFCVFGVPTGISLFAQGDRAVDDHPHGLQLLRDASGRGPFRCLSTVPHIATRCEAARTWINEESTLARLDVWAMRVATTFAADWFRLDLFAGDPAMGWRVNEVTYPSHLEFPNAVWTHYAKRYANRTGWTTEAAPRVLERVASLANLSSSLVHTRSTARMQSAVASSLSRARMRKGG